MLCCSIVLIARCGPRHQGQGEESVQLVVSASTSAMCRRNGPIILISHCRVALMPLAAHHEIAPRQSIVVKPGSCSLHTGPRRETAAYSCQHHGCDKTLVKMIPSPARGARYSEHAWVANRSRRSHVMPTTLVPHLVLDLVQFLFRRAKVGVNDCRRYNDGVQSVEAPGSSGGRVVMILACIPTPTKHLGPLFFEPPATVSIPVPFLALQGCPFLFFLSFSSPLCCSPLSTPNLPSDTL